MAANNTENATALSSKEFADIMSAIGYFEPYPTIAVAVSGGVDSMALLLLAQGWVAKNGGKVIAITINHRLRTEAKDEAEQVAFWCKEHSIEHKILSWQYSQKPSSAIQAQARAARYNLLTDYCRSNNIIHLLTAHHQGDQAETIFLRLVHGSNLSGLSSMSAQSIISGVRLLRPLLAIPKSRLIATLKAKRQGWLEDPSNQNHDYERVRTRSKLAGNVAVQESAHDLSHKFACFRNLLENKIASELTNGVELYNSGYAIIKTPAISVMALSAMITTLSGDQHPPRTEKLAGLHLAISTGTLGKRSLSGLLFEQTGAGKILVYREEKAIQPPLALPANTTTFWDERFLATCNFTGTPTLQIRAIGGDGIAQIRKYTPQLLRNAPPSRILRTFPSFWLLEELISVPHIGYMTKKTGFSAVKADIKFYPAKPLAGSGFFVMNKQT